ncbi:MAG: OmpA family protein [Acidobacteria bacterium]|nr:OmpA family protein [Acidobacteriota bacterium]
MFDSIIKQAQDKFNLGDKAGGLLASLLGLIANPANGGFAGFIGRFKDAGLGDAADSWIAKGDSAPVSDEQLESALGADTLAQVAEQSGVDRATATKALGFMTPRVVDALTPDGEAPDEAGLIAKIRGVLTEYGGAIGAAVLGGLGAAGALAAGAAGKVGDAAGATLDAGKAVLGKGADAVGDAAGATVDAGKKAIGAVGDAAGATLGKVGGAIGSVGGALDGGGDSGGILRWLIPLMLLGILLVLGYWFCNTKSTPIASVPAGNANVSKPAANTSAPPAAKTVDSSFKIEAKDGKYVVTGVVPDQQTLDEIKAKLEAQFGAGNVDYAGLRVDANAKPFAAGWWDNFQKLLPGLKDWKNGSLAFAGNAITAAAGLPPAVVDQIKSLFGGGGWLLPVSIAGEAEATKEANDEALKELGSAASVDEVIAALNVSILNFKSGSAEIPADAKPILEKAAAVLSKQSEGTVIEIGGYTDNKGNADRNKNLSQQRADSVKKALVALGVKETMLKAVGYGDANPVGDNNTEDGRFKNRRIEYRKSDGTAPTAVTTTTRAPANAAK